jgi:tetratricopeptide (TPR) repeat protein
MRRDDFDLSNRDRASMIEAAISVGVATARDENGAGRYGTALELGRASLELATNDIKARCVLYVQALATTAEALRRLGRLHDAREHAEQAVSVVRQLNHHGIAPDTLHVLARVLSDMGELSRARVLAWRAFHILRFRGAEYWENCEVLATLSLVECRRGMFADASRLARRGLHALARASRMDHPVRARLLHHHGVARYMAGNVVLAARLLAQSLSERRRLLGHGHPETIEGMASVAALHLVQGAFASAYETYLEAMALAEKSLGEDHVLVADCAVGLAFAIQRLGGREAKARATDLLERSRRIRRRLAAREA